MSLENNPYVEKAEAGLRNKGDNLTDPRTNALLAVAYELNMVWRTLRDLEKSPITKRVEQKKELFEKKDKG